MAVIGRSCFASSWRISHLDMKPVKGGSPPRERRVISEIETRAGLLDQVMARVLILVLISVLRVKKAAEVIKI